jgi:hypothetical protein
VIVCVFGRRGCGKTTQIRARIERLSRILIFDSLGEYGEDATQFDSLDDLLGELQEHERGVFRLSFLAYDDPDYAFEVLCRAAWVVGDVTLIVDEVDLVTSPISVPDPFRKLVAYGRHRAVSIIAASRRAACVPRLLTSQADEILSFNQSEPTDQEYLRATVGRQFSDGAAALPRYRYVAWTPWTQHVAFKPLDSREIPCYDTSVEPEPAPAASLPADGAGS